MGQEDPLEEGMATYSSILAWRIPMDRGAWWATVHGITELHMTKRLSRTQYFEEEVMRWPCETQNDVCVHVCLHVHPLSQVYVCVHVCTCMYMYVRVCVCVCVCTSPQASRRY